LRTLLELWVLVIESQIKLFSLGNMGMEKQRQLACGLKAFLN